MNKKKILYVDMDNVLVDFPTGIARLTAEERQRYEPDLDDCPDIFSKMDPLPDAVESFKKLAKHFDAYILSTSPWGNPSGWQHKIEWVHKHLGKEDGTPAYKRLIISHHKNLNKGDFLIDDRTKNGVLEFEGEHIHFGTDPRFMKWPAVVEYLMNKLDEEDEGDIGI